ncbi:hypothetical protein DAI22_09g093101 [Oryza sativa Japonica Group]|nr:hypothetical protein DAI22_09g093101 [Oryza sativa Japonica Group]
MELTWRLQPAAPHTALPQAAADRVPAWRRRELPRARSRLRTAARRAPHGRYSRAARTAPSPSPRRHLGGVPRRSLPAWLPATERRTTASRHHTRPKRGASTILICGAFS